MIKRKSMTSKWQLLACLAVSMIMPRHGFTHTDLGQGVPVFDPCELMSRTVSCIIFNSNSAMIVGEGILSFTAESSTVIYHLEAAEIYPNLNPVGRGWRQTNNFLGGVVCYAIYDSSEQLVKSGEMVINPTSANTGRGVLALDDLVRDTHRIETCGGVYWIGMNGALYSGSHRREAVLRNP